MASKQYMLTQEGMLIALDANIKTDWSKLSIVSGATYESLQDYIDTAGDSGKLTGGDASDDADGTITMSAMTGVIYITDSPTGSLVFFDLAQDTTVSLTDEALNYIYAQYNGGTPRYQATTAETDISGTDEFVVALVWKSGTDLHIANVGKHIEQFPQQLFRHSFYIDGLERMWGLITTENGTRQLDVTVGALSWALHELGVAAKTAGSFKMFYNDGSWQESGATTTIPNTQYNDYGTGLTDLTANRYGVYWVYIVCDGDMYAVYGIGNYTLAQAQGADSPGNLPPELANIGVLVAKIIVQKNSTNFYSIILPWEVGIAGSAATDHGGLAGLSDDDHTQYVPLDGVARSNLGAVSWYIGDTANAKMTVGLTVNQGANDDEILTLKSSDVAHGMTDNAEADTFAAFYKNDPAAGGLAILGFSESDFAATIVGHVTTASETKSSAGLGAVQLVGRLKSGTGAGAMGADDNVVAMRDHTSTLWILDADGDVWHTGELSVNAADIDGALQIGNSTVTSHDGPYVGFAASFLTGSWDTTDPAKDGGYFHFSPDTGVGTTKFQWGFVDKDAPSALTAVALYKQMQMVLGSGTLNTKQTVGLTINQGANDDAILDFKSTDISHGFTDVVEANTFGVYYKNHATSGGVALLGFSESTFALTLTGYVTTADETKSTAALGAVQFVGRLKTGATGGSMAGVDNVVVMRNHTATQWILDASGNTWQVGHATMDYALFDNIKSGATQVAAGAAQHEVWKTSSHATLPDNVLMIGV